MFMNWQRSMTFGTWFLSGDLAGQRVEWGLAIKSQTWISWDMLGQPISGIHKGSPHRSDYYPLTPVFFVFHSFYTARLGDWSSTCTQQMTSLWRPIAVELSREIDSVVQRSLGSFPWTSRAAIWTGASWFLHATEPPTFCQDCPLASKRSPIPGVLVNPTSNYRKKESESRAKQNPGHLRHEMYLILWFL